MEEIRREALLEIPDDLNLNISGLSNECREVIMQAKPGNVSCLLLLLALFFPGLFVTLSSHFCSFVVVWGLGSWIGILGLGLSGDGVWGLWCWAFGGFGFGISL